jgi:hypothetical protein
VTTKAVPSGSSSIVLFNLSVKHRRNTVEVCRSTRRATVEQMRSTVCGPNKDTLLAYNLYLGPGEISERDLNVVALT